MLSAAPAACARSWASEGRLAGSAKTGRFHCVPRSTPRTASASYLRSRVRCWLYYSASDVWRLAEGFI